MEARTQDYGAIGWCVNHLRLGHKMRRAAWPADTYLALDITAGKPGIIRLFAADQPGQLWHNSNADVLAADWALLDPTLPGEYHASTP